jgi:hypothetical protein
MTLEDKLIKSIKEYTYPDFHEIWCNSNYYECSMCGAKMKWEEERSKRKPSEILDMILHYDDCPYKLARSKDEKK